MGKRKHENETEEERSERKRKKKEAKKKKKAAKDRESSESSRPQIKSSLDFSKLDSTSHVFWKQWIEMTISLLPSALGNVLASVENVIRQMLLRYFDGLQGILLAFDTVKILDEGKGFILNELPHIHYKILVNALIFRPTAGCQLSGTITESFHSHLSLVVFNYFNASISAEHLRKAGYVFDHQEEKWRWSSDAETISPGDKLIFRCDKMHESGGIISLEGSIPCNS